MCINVTANNNKIRSVSPNISSLDLSNISSNSASSSTPRVQKKTLDDYETVILPSKGTADLGKGSYGSVKLVKEKGNSNNEYFAMKIVSCIKMKFQNNLV